MPPALHRLPARAVHGVRWRARAARRRFTQPLVSVVVPVYNVQTYVEECLTSLLTQTHRRLQVIVVDDGGTDASMDIVRRVTADDRRITIVSQPNAGLGAARNTGARVAKGTYLRFIDSDDVLPPDSIEIMVRSLQRTGSDFVVGNLRRLTSAKAWVPGWAQQVHRVDRLAISLDDLPDVLKDPFAHNKLFRTDFFREVVLAWPEGILYEDQEPTARAYTNGRFDVLSAVVYDWRIREDGTSITQQKSDPVDLRDRLLVKNRVGQIMAAGASPAVAQHWLAKAIGFDLRPYYEQVPRTGPEFWEQLRAGVTRFAEQVDVGVWQQVPMLDRLLALAVVHDRRADVISLLTTREEYGWSVPGVAADGVVQLDPAYLSDLQLPLDPALLRLAEADLSVRSSIQAVRWEGSTLSLDAFAHIRNLDLARAPQTVEVELVCDESGESRPMRVIPRAEPSCDLESGDAWNTFADAGFTASADLSEWPLVPGETWRAHVRLEAGGVRRTEPLSSTDQRRAVAHLPVGTWQPGVGRWVLDHARHVALGVKLDLPGNPEVVEVSAQGTDVEIVLAPTGPEVAALLVEHTNRLTGRRRYRVLPLGPGPDRHRFRVSLPSVPSALRHDAVEWKLRAETPSGPARLVWTGTSAALAARREPAAVVDAVCSREGTLRLRQNAWVAVLTDVVLHEGEREQPEHVELVGRLSPVPDASWTGSLVGENHRRTAAIPVLPAEDGSFTVEAPLLTDAGVPVVAGAYELELTCTEPGGEVLTRAIGPSDALLDRFPLERQTRRRGLTCTRTGTGAVRLRPRRPHRDDERGRLAQRRIHQLFSRDVDQDVEAECFVFECFSARNVGDSPLALCRELQARHPQGRFFWSVDELTTPVPDGVQPLLRYTWEWAETVRAARWLVNNANFPFFFRKGSQQTYVQTWHGTPLKKIGLDVPPASLSLSYRALMERETKAWDVLLAQGPFAADVLPRAFGYAGRVIAQGYPRNDVLVDGDTTRTRVRGELGLREQDHVVLYAPTWRDDVRTATGAYALVSYLDFDLAASRLGDVRFLLRGHSNTAAAGYSSDAVRDVSGYPDVNELMLAADALVTDYSSVMFDFCVTGKPIYFLVPDLERYGSTTRGFYFDLSEVAPGPVCLTDVELVDALADRASYTDTYAERYAAFVDRFAPLDDGHASERVVDQVWGSAPA